MFPWGPGSGGDRWVKDFCCPQLSRPFLEDRDLMRPEGKRVARVLRGVGSCGSSHTVAVLCVGLSSVWHLWTLATPHPPLLPCGSAVTQPLESSPVTCTTLLVTAPGDTSSVLGGTLWKKGK